MPHFLIHVFLCLFIYFAGIYFSFSLICSRNDVVSGVAYWRFGFRDLESPHVAEFLIENHDMGFAALRLLFHPFSLQGWIISKKVTHIHKKYKSTLYGNMTSLSIFLINTG